MNIEVFNFAVEKDTKLNNLVDTLVKRGFSPVFREAHNLISVKLQPLKLSASLTPFGFADRELLIAPKSESAVILRTVNIDHRPNCFNIMFVFNKKENEFKSMVQEILKVEMKKYSWEENQLIEGLKKRFGELSPNGKALADPQLRASLRLLYDDGLRERILSVVSSFGDKPVPLEMFFHLEPFKKDIESLTPFIQNQNIIVNEFAIHCTECEEETNITFKERAKAERTLEESRKKCIVCGNNKLKVKELFAVDESYIRGIQQGLWLEALASDVLASHTGAVWSGQMVESNEIDVLGVMAESIILVECKDTNFGQNDLYIAAVKAEQVRADIVLIISTNDIHPNVMEALDKLGRGSRRFQVISSGSSQALSNELCKVLCEISKNYVEKSYCTPSEGLYPFVRSFSTHRFLGR